MNKQRQTDKIRQQKGYPFWPWDPTLKKYQKTKGLTRKWKFVFDIYPELKDIISKFAKIGTDVHTADLMQIEM